MTEKDIEKSEELYWMSQCLLDENEILQYIILKGI